MRKRKRGGGLRKERRRRKKSSKTAVVRKTPVFIIEHKNATFPTFRPRRRKREKMRKKGEKAAAQICEEKKLTGGRLHEKGRSANKPAFCGKFRIRT